MHLFEYAMRDVLNTEAHANPRGVIFVHDCCPFNAAMTTRDLANLPDTWTGDVWKLIPILREYRPDLNLTILDAKPTGLLAITDLKPGAAQPHIDLSDIGARYESIDLESFGYGKFADLFEFTSTKSAIEEDRFSLGSLSDPSLTSTVPDLVTP